jgi:hypothetical protein
MMVRWACFASCSHRRGTDPAHGRATQQAVSLWCEQAEAPGGLGAVGSPSEPSGVGRGGEGRGDDADVVVGALWSEFVQDVLAELVCGAGEAVDDVAELCDPVVADAFERFD